ncbi:MAG: DUF4097 family beta strand repeat-containing protein [Gammaproteobacteria bacterium]|nr:DUF4097 family beta strand repeat-containing protein [Gammaproteobacteria bacterium]
MKLSVVMLIALGLATTVAASDDIDELADADPRGRVEVSNTSGNVNVRGWSRDEIRIKGTLAAGAERLDFIRDGKHTLIKVIHPKGAHHIGSSNLDIRIPEGSELRVMAVSADITVENVHGIQNLQTVSGEIETTVFEADLEARTVSGDVEVQGHHNATLVTIMTVSGDADITDIGGEVEASAVSGDLTIEADMLTRVRLRTTNGDITVQGALASGGRLDGETVNGDVEIMLADISNLSINVETFNGDIDHCFDAEVERKSRYGPGRELRWNRGDSERSVRVKTLNGDVEICHLNR